MTIPNRSWRDRRDWRDGVRRFTRTVQTVEQAKWEEQQAWEAAYEAAAEEYMFERHYW